MAYTVKKLAQISGVSVRTLHYYDEIGLLKPAYYGSNGYRFYEEEQLLQLQQILFFRELGFELKKIQKLLGRGDFDKIALLGSHRKVLQKNLERTRKLIETIEKTIDHLKGKKKMKDHEMYLGFSKEKQEEYEKYLINRYGSDAEALIAESQKNVKNWKKEDWNRAKLEGERINRELVEAIEKKLKPDAVAVQSIVRKLYVWLQHFYMPTKEVFEGLGKLYMEHPDFQKYYAAYHPKLAEFLAEAMKIFAKQELS